MKLNFWQWLGVVLLIVATGFWLNGKRNERKVKEAGTASPAMIAPEEEPTTEPTEPASAPTTTPT